MSALPPKADMCTGLTSALLYRARSADRKFQQLDRVEILHAAADALGRIEQHVWLGGIRIAKDRDARTIDDEVAAIKITECNCKRPCRDVRHVFLFDDGKGHQSGPCTYRSWWLPKIVPSRVFKFSDGRLRLAIQYKYTVLTIACFCRIDQIDKHVCWI